MPRHADVHQLSAQIVKMDNRTGIPTVFSKPKPPYLPPRSLFEGTFTVVGPGPEPEKSKTAESDAVPIPSTSKKPELGPWGPLPPELPDPTERTTNKSGTGPRDTGGNWK
jgi:hypothetical protein